jgi:hypothetical protein
MEVRRVIARFQLSTPLSSWLAREETKMETKAQEVGYYIAATMPRKMPVIGDTIRGFDGFDIITPEIHAAYVERAQELELNRRIYVSNHRKSLKTQRKQNMYS